VTFDEAARRYAQQLTDNDEYRRSWRERKKVEALFAELKMLSNSDDFDYVDYVMSRNKR